MKQSTNMKLVFFGSSKYVLSVIHTLRDNFDLVLVITTEKAPTDIISAFCEKNGIPHLSVSSISDRNVHRQLLQVNCQLAVLADFGLIIPQNILKLFSKGIINIHPSFLPKYRGPSPVQSAIMYGDKTTGVTIIKLDSQIDHGPILFQKMEKILDDDTTESLYLKLFKIGANNIHQSIHQYIKSGLSPIPQDDSRATFTKLLNKTDGQIYLDTPPSKEVIKRLIRAYYPWPGVFLKIELSKKEKIIKLLPEDKIQVEGKNPMSYRDFINGYSEGEEIIKKLNLS